MRLIEFLYHSTLGLRVIKKKKMTNRLCVLPIAPEIDISRDVDFRLTSRNAADKDISPYLVGLVPCNPHQDRF